jgi:ribulose-5-phosphate 4-epimerase/fuculose-1-phosphate aldolase
MNEAELRQQIVRFGRSLFERGLTYGSSGNLSARLGERYLMTPTNASLGALDEHRLSLVDREGRLLSGDAPTRESFLHLGLYHERPSAGAVVHLHCTHAVAVSCLADVDPRNVIPPITAYYVMRIGRLPLIPYYPPGDMALAQAVRSLAAEHGAMLLANHGPLVSAGSLEAAVYAAEELEETARLFLLLRKENFSALDAKQIEELRRRYPQP